MRYLQPKLLWDVYLTVLSSSLFCAGNKNSCSSTSPLKTLRLIINNGSTQNDNETHSLYRKKIKTGTFNVICLIGINTLEDDNETHNQQLDNIIKILVLLCQIFL